MRWWGVLLWLLSGQAWTANVLVIQSYHSGYACNRIERGD